MWWLWNWSCSAQVVGKCRQENVRLISFWTSQPTIRKNRNQVKVVLLNKIFENWKMLPINSAGGSFKGIITEATDESTITNVL